MKTNANIFDYNNIITNKNANRFRLQRACTNKSVEVPQLQTFVTFTTKFPNNLQIPRSQNQARIIAVTLNKSCCCIVQARNFDLMWIVVCCKMQCNINCCKRKVKITWFDCKLYSYYLAMWLYDCDNISQSDNQRSQSSC